MYAISKTTENVLARPFIKMGARVRFGEPEIPRWSGREIRPIALDVRNDRHGEYFLIGKRADVSVEILEVQPRDRHLVLLARVPEGLKEVKSRFLLGHDERHWFVAAIPERSPVSTVWEAKQALKPLPIRWREHRIRSKNRNDRSNEISIRQGEWFFVPVMNITVSDWLVRKHEPLVRGAGSKPHVCQELYRVGGETVYVNPGHNRVLSVAQYSRLSDSARTLPGWRTMVRNPRVFVRGTVRHSDHKTIFLEGWHEVLMNTENNAAAMRNVAFLD
ncbi:MAG TPA: hypothetical protein VFF39_13170 [Verrucomicrobiae bacterium]|nr:hypothetical protein [Verrucomicrobiae bacterium]